MSVLLYLIALLLPTVQTEQASIRSVPAAEIRKGIEDFIKEKKIPEDDARAMLGVLSFEDFKGTGIDGRPVNLTNPGEPGYTGTKLVIFGYYAEWCGNCRHNLPSLLRLYEKHHASGLEVVLTFMYSDSAKVKNFVAEREIPFRVLIGSEDRRVNPDIRLQTTHYVLRTIMGDYRRWGTPFYIIYDTQEPGMWHIVAGEFIEDEVGEFVDSRLRD
jgi:thiol-disulfide isomerase/thioredoxin